MDLTDKGKDDHKADVDSQLVIQVSEFIFLTVRVVFNCNILYTGEFPEAYVVGRIFN